MILLDVRSGNVVKEAIMWDSDKTKIQFLRKCSELENYKDLAKEIERLEQNQLSQGETSVNVEELEGLREVRAEFEKQLKEKTEEFEKKLKERDVHICQLKNLENDLKGKTEKLAFLEEENKEQRGILVHLFIAHFELLSFSDCNHEKLNKQCKFCLADHHENLFL